MEDKVGLTLACLNIKKLVKMMTGKTYNFTPISQYYWIIGELGKNIKKTNIKNDVCLHSESSIELFFLVLNCPNADRFFRNWEVSPSVFVDGYSIRAVSKNVVEGLAGPITTNFHRLAVSSIIRDCYS